MSRPPLSIVIPTWNAMPRLAACLEALVPGLSAGLIRDVVVVDAGSTDQSRDLALDMGCRVLDVGAAGRGRGTQLIAGANAAKGDWLMFLHGDCVLPQDWVSTIQAHTEQAPHHAGYFALSFDDQTAPARRIAWWANLRARCLGLPYGDQGLVISRTLYDEIGGYKPLALMEDVDLVRRLGRGRLRGLPCGVETSASRYRAGGWWFVPLRNLTLLAGFYGGVSPERLRGWYR